MAFESGPFDAALAAAAGEDMALQHELRKAFSDSVARQFDLLQRARCDGNWEVAANRLRGLAASFHVSELMELADQALKSAPGEPTIIRAIDSFVQDFGGNTPD